MSKLTSNIKPIGFKSPFTYEGDQYTVEGNFRANQDKQLTGIDGTIKKDESYKGNFNGEMSPESGLRYSIGGVDDMKEFGAIAAVVDEAVTAVNELLKQGESE